MNNCLKNKSESYKICSKYFNKNQLLIWINLFGSLTQLKLLSELRLLHNLPIDFLRFKEINRRKKNDNKVTLEKYITKYEDRVYTNYNGFSTTETFNKDVLEGYYETNIQTNS